MAKNDGGDSLAPVASLFISLTFLVRMIIISIIMSKHPDYKLYCSQMYVTRQYRRQEIDRKIMNSFSKIAKDLEQLWGHFEQKKMDKIIKGAPRGSLCLEQVTNEQKRVLIICGLLSRRWRYCTSSRARLRYYTSSRLR